MKKRLPSFNFLRVWCALFVGLCVYGGVGYAQQDTKPPFAVVELFTSEGCSSCPTADIILSKLVATSRQNNIRIYPLSFHVDYWNSLGWRDPFSSNAFTERQYNYARLFKTDAYTPQIVVNGTDGFPGYDQDKLQKVLNEQLSSPASANIKVVVLKQDDDRIVVGYNVQGAGKGDVVHLALVERGLSMEVTRGENAGRTLRHDNVVKEWETVDLTKPQGQVSLSLRKIRDRYQASVVAYVQNPATMLIEAVQQLDLG